MSGLEDKPIYCEAKKHVHIAGPPLDCEICRWKNECLVHRRLEDAQQETQNLKEIWERTAHGYDCAIDGNLKRIEELEERLERIRSLIKEFPINFLDVMFTEDVDELKKWLERLKKEASQ